MPGPAPKPHRLRVLEGTTGRGADRHRNQPPVLPDIPPEPDWDELPDERVRDRAQTEWQRVTTILDRGYMIASSDLTALHGAVVAYAYWRVALMDDDIGMAQRWLRIALTDATKCGLTPTDRLRLGVPAASSFGLTSTRWRRSGPAGLHSRPGIS